MDFTQIWKRSCKWRVFFGAITLVSVSLAAHAQSSGGKPGVEVLTSGAQDSTALYEERVSDLTIKTLLGPVRLERMWANGRWSFNPRWADLQFFSRAERQGASNISGRSGAGAVTSGTSGGRGFGAPGDVDGSIAPENIKRIRVNTYSFNSVNEENTVYKYLKKDTIVRSDMGYRWTNPQGDWIEYGFDGKMQRFGDRHNNEITLTRHANGLIESLVDQFGTTLATYTFDEDMRPLTLVDYIGRQVVYTWEGADLTTVNDVRGLDWQYTYEEVGYARVMASKTDPVGRVIVLTHQVGGGGSIGNSGNGGSSGGGGAGGVSSGGGSSCSGGTGGRWAQNASGNWEYTYASCTQQSRPMPGATATPMLITIEDDVGVVTDNRYFYDAVSKQYKNIKRRAGQGIQAIDVNLNGETTARYINGELLIEKSISADRRRIVEQDRNGYRTVRTYDELENLIRIQYPDGTEENWTYGAYANITRHTDERGVITTYSYNTQGDLIRRVEAQGTAAERITEYEYDTLGRMTLMREVGDVNTSEAVTRWTSYDNYGNVLTKSDPEGIETRYTYDVLGNVLTYRDGRANTWTYTYDAAGNLRTVTDPLSHITQYTYDGVGNMLTVTDALGTVLARYTYNARNMVTSITNAYDQTKQLIYNSDNQLVSVLDENGHATTLTYDSFGRLQSMTDAVGNLTHFSYAAEGAQLNGISEIHYPTYSERYSYDRRYRVNAITQVLQEAVSEEDSDDGQGIPEESLTTQFRYDAAGNLTHMIDPAGREQLRSYDPLARVTSMQSPGGATVLYNYDDRDNVLSVINELNVPIRSFGYDRKNQQVAEQWPTSESMSFGYDGNGNLELHIDGKGQRTEYDYDLANRLSGADYFADETAPSPQKTVSYSYNAANSLTGYNDGTYAATYNYDLMQRPLSRSINYGAFSLSHAYTYNASGRKASLTYPDGTANSYFYDDADKLTRFTIPGQGTITVNQYNWQAPAQVTYPGGSVQNVTYDALMRPQRIHVQDPGDNTLMDYNYQYDALSSITQKATEHGVYDYSYDVRSRLTSAVNPTLANEAYTYDATGNRLSASATGADPWQYNATNQLTQIGGQQSFSYDANGSLISKTDSGVTQNYVYNLENRLSEVRDAGNALVATYDYDPFGRRIAKTVGSETTFFHYSDEGLIAEYDTSGALIQSYGYSPDGMWGTDPVYTRVNGQVHYYLNDHLGTPQKLIASNGAVGWSGHMSAFGLMTENSNSTVRNPLRFPGQYFDSETGFYQNYFRDYAAGLGRYVQSDPIGLMGGMHSYGYAYQNPLIFTDPLGLHGQMSRHRGRQTGPRSQSRVGVVGCAGPYCASYIQGDPSAQGSLGVGGLGGAILICSPPAQPDPTDPTSPDPNCSSSGNSGSNSPSYGGSPPGRMGFILGGQRNADGSYCISVGLMGTFPGPNWSTGSI